MKVLDSILDNSPAATDIAEMAETRIRNLQCFRELQSLNDKGQFENIHPFLVHREELLKLRELWNTDREAFLREYNNCKTNIRRYRGQLAKEGLTEEEREKKMAQLMRHQEREKVFKEIFSNGTND